MSNDDADELSSIRIKREAEDRFLKRLDFSARLGRVVYIVVASVIAATLWLSSLQYEVKDNRHDIDRNREAVRIVWEKFFGYPMPP